MRHLKVKEMVKGALQHQRPSNSTILWIPAILKALYSWKHFRVHNLIVCLLSSHLNYTSTASPVRVYAFACDFPGPGSQPNFPHQILLPLKHSCAHTIASSSTELCLLDSPDVLDFLPKAKVILALLTTLWGKSLPRTVRNRSGWQRRSLSKLLGSDSHSQENIASQVLPLNFQKLQLPLNSWQRGLFFLSVCFVF